MEQDFSLKVLAGMYSIVEVSDRPEWPATGSGFFCLTRLAGAWTVICAEEAVPDASLVIANSSGWRVFFIAECLTFDMIGVIHRIAEILKDAGISVMAISAFSTDAFLVRADDLQPALSALQAGGFAVR